MRDVEEDDAAYAELMALGVRSVPATVIGSTIVKGFDPVQIRRALKADAGGS